jgi:hypothetical protein
MSMNSKTPDLQTTKLDPETVRYIAKWVRSLYIPSSSIGDNLHIAACIEGMSKSADYPNEKIWSIAGDLHDRLSTLEGQTAVDEIANTLVRAIREVPNVQG